MLMVKRALRERGLATDTRFDSAGDVWAEVYPDGLTLFDPTFHRAQAGEDGDEPLAVARAARSALEAE